jgi:hypothetical protein
LRRLAQLQVLYGDQAELLKKTEEQKLRAEKNEAAAKAAKAEAVASKDEAVKAKAEAEAAYLKEKQRADEMKKQLGSTTIDTLK